ncbi:winged helix-turn-helix domain-containing protein [Cupriavidus basilensis]
MRLKEHTALEILMMRLGKTVSKASLLSGVYSLDEEASEEAIEIYLSTAFARNSEGCQGHHWQTLRGLGYLLQQKQ